MDNGVGDGCEWSYFRDGWMDGRYIGKLTDQSFSNRQIICSPSNTMNGIFPSAQCSWTNLVYQVSTMDGKKKDLFFYVIRPYNIGFRAAFICYWRHYKCGSHVTSFELGKKSRVAHAVNIYLIFLQTQRLPSLTILINNCLSSVI